jgi:hypothetical protein
MTEAKHIERTETTCPDHRLVDEAKMDAMSAHDKNVIYAQAAYLTMHRGLEFLEWYMGLEHATEVKIGVGVHGQISGFRSVIVVADDHTWHFTATEAIHIVFGLEDVNARWTATTGKAPDKMSIYLVQGLRVCIKSMLDMTQDEIEEAEESLEVDDIGRHIYDGRMKQKRN